MDFLNIVQFCFWCFSYIYWKTEKEDFAVLLFTGNGNFYNFLSRDSSLPMNIGENTDFVMKHNIHTTFISMR